LAQSYRLIAATLDVIENDMVCRSTLPRCEPQLGRRGLYRATGQDKGAEAANLALLWVLNLSDDAHSLLDIAERANLPFADVYRTAQLLQQHGLLTARPAGFDGADATRASQ
jgi:aminopeptidase-like protein